MLRVREMGAESSYISDDSSRDERGRSAGATAMRHRGTIALAVLGLAIVWPFLQIGLIVMQAQYFANGRPYCVDLGDYHRTYAPTYRPAASLFELNGFSLRAPLLETSGSGSFGLTQFSFHALLIVDDGRAFEWRNWSRWHQHFDRLTPEQVTATRHYKPVCQPERDFLLKLPFFSK
jgi:hypothetical protein